MYKRQTNDKHIDRRKSLIGNLSMNIIQKLDSGKDIYSSRLVAVVVVIYLTYNISCHEHI